MLSNLSANALSILGTEAINANDEGRGSLKDSAIAPHPRRKTATAPRMHCFEFRELLQAQRRKWLPQVPAMIASGDSQELQEIDAALARIGDGSYGSCIDCGGEIGRARLKTEPTATRCPPCKIRESPIYLGDEQ